MPHANSSSTTNETWAASTDFVLSYFQSHQWHIRTIKTYAYDFLPLVYQALDVRKYVGYLNTGTRTSGCKCPAFYGVDLG